MGYNGIADILERIFKGYIKPGDIDVGLMSEQYKALFKGVEEGMKLDWEHTDYDTPDGHMLEVLRENVFVFSGFKSYHELKDISAKLLDENGKLRSFEDFKREALKVHEEYNVHWLNAEYNHAVASAQMAGKWARIERDKDVLPLLRYNAVRDKRTTSLCNGLDGTVKPVDDPFWDRYYPPNHWGCRSDVDQEERGRITPDNKLIIPDIPDMFQHNVGKKGVVFPPKHPYYRVEPDHKAKVIAGIEQAKEEEGIFTPAKTLKEAENYALRMGLAKEVSYKKMPLEYVNATNRALFELKQLTGQTYHRVAITSFRGRAALVSPMHNAHYHGISRNDLEINRKYFERFKNMEEFTSETVNTYKRNWWTIQSYKGMIAHEFGHRLTVENIYKVPKPLRIGISGVSIYGKTNLQESTAEIFAKYIQEGKDALKPEWIDLFNKYSIFKI